MATPSDASAFAARVGKDVLGFVNLTGESSVTTRCSHAARLEPRPSRASCLFPEPCPFISTLTRFADPRGCGGF